MMRRLFYSLLFTLPGLLFSAAAQAQQLPMADSSARPVMSAGAQQSSGVTDVIVRTNGDELPARVLRITPLVVRYLPVAAATDTAQTAATDTLQLAAADVFMVRFANGTKEVLRAAPVPGASLLGLSRVQRHEQGRQDSRRYYKPAKGVFWGTFAGTVVTAGYGGVVVGGAIALTPPPRYNLNAPEPALLDDPAYYDGYRRQAKNRKLGKAAAGFGVGVGALATVGTLLLIALYSAFN